MAAYEYIIETRGLVKRYGKLTAVNNLSVQVPRGAIYGFVGPNGAGKTTTMRILTTLITPTAGDAYVSGYSVVAYPREVRRVIGYMPDFFGVYDDIKVWEYLDFFAAAYKIERSRRPQIIDDVLALTDLGVKKEAFVEELSRGMKQRLCLAKTLLHDPKVLFLDEPASGLDPRARIEIRELLKALRGMGKTILISSHILTELADFVTKVAIIEAGSMVVTGSVADIMAQLEPFKRVHVTVASDVDHACRVLETIEGVHNVHATDHRIELEYHGEEIEFALVMPQLIHEGVVVTGFGVSEANLE